MRLSRHRWSEPLYAAAGLEGRDWAACLLSDGGAHGRWSYVLAEPEETWVGETDPTAPFDALRRMLSPTPPPPATEGPPFQGGVLGLAAYDLALPDREQAWPGLTLARYGSVLAFDHHEGEVWAIGERAEAWLAGGRAPEPPVTPLAADFTAEAPDGAYVAAVADVVERIWAGEIFQANIARAWGGRLADGADPFDLFVRLAGQSPAPYAAWWRLPDRALVSNSPEAFLSVTPDGAVETRPIKGTRPRNPDAATDAALAAELAASEKDRAENLMIVDLMRNDLSRVCRPGTVTVDGLCEVESFRNVHHLVSTVRGRLEEGRSVSDLLEGAFPPGSITGAPKRQAMSVIAGHERPRGAWCGSLLLAGDDGGMNASVLIRTVSLWRQDAAWRYRTLAGAGIVADSEPEAELAETTAKIAAIRHALEAGSPPTEG